MSDWALGIMQALGYLGLALVLILENLLPPIPSEAVLPLAGLAALRVDQQRTGPSRANKG